MNPVILDTYKPRDFSSTLCSILYSTRSIYPRSSPTRINRSSFTNERPTRLKTRRNNLCGEFPRWKQRQKRKEIHRMEETRANSIESISSYRNGYKRIVSAIVVWSNVLFDRWKEGVGRYSREFPVGKEDLRRRKSCGWRARTDVILNRNMDKRRERRKKRNKLWSRWPTTRQEEELETRWFNNCNR